MDFNAILENTQNVRAQSFTQEAPVVAPVLPAIPSSVAQDYQGNDQNLFSIEKIALPCPKTGGTISGKNGLFVDNDCINIVSDNYAIHQPNDIIKQFYEVSEKCNLSVNRVLTNKNNGSLLLSAKYDNLKIVGEDHDVNLTFYASHDGKRKSVLSGDILRIACFNQVPTIFRNKGRFLFAEKHYKSSLLSIENIQNHLEFMPEIVANYNETAQKLKETKLNFSDFIDLYKKLYKLEEGKRGYDQRVLEAKNTYYNATSQNDLEDNTAYKAFNAITYHNTHNDNGRKIKEGRELENRHFDANKKTLDFLELLEVEHVLA